MEEEGKVERAPVRRRSSPRIPPGVRVALHHLTVAVAAGGAALALMGLVPPVRNQIGPATVEGRAALGASRTDLQFPPLGTISARTHSGPLKVTFTVSS
ncbi:MAG: hypothetical protein ACRDIU_05015, partial [Actinomycetota bacterium]